jgi:pimeloyl-ACP methyl ester carboxylesterase
MADPAMAAFPPPGRLVDVDGRRRHLFCTGTGRPAVILEEGAGGASLNWVWIQPKVATATRVCSYDRPGYGWSDPSDTPRDAETVGRELDALLKSALLSNKAHVAVVSDAIIRMVHSFQHR